MKSWRTGVIVGATLVAALTGCGGAPRLDCGRPGSETDMSLDPPYVSYVKGWKNAVGCDVHRDIIATREDGGDCYPGSIDEILMGSPLGISTENTRTRIYIRDPYNWAEDKWVVGRLQVDVELPADAKDTGYRYGRLELWMSPNDSFIYLRGPDGVEAWPQVVSLPGCA